MTSVVQILHDDRTKVLLCWWAINTSPVTLGGLNSFERGAPGHQWLTISTNTRRSAPLQRPRQEQCPALRTGMILLLSPHLAIQRSKRERLRWVRDASRQQGSRQVTSPTAETDVRTISAGSSDGGTNAVLTCGGGDTGSGRTALGEMNLPASSAVASRFYISTDVCTYAPRRRGGRRRHAPRGGVVSQEKKKRGGNAPPMGLQHRGFKPGTPRRHPHPPPSPPRLTRRPDGVAARLGEGCQPTQGPAYVDPRVAASPPSIGECTATVTIIRHNL